MASTPAFTDAAETWNRRYAGDDFLFGTAPNAWLREHVAHLPPGGRVLCVADGEGRNSVWLARQGFRVEAFDIAARAVEKAEAFARREGVSVRYAVADIDGYDWPEAAFDGIVAIFVQFADPQTRTRLFERMVRSLAPGGVLILQGYTPAQLAHGTGGPGKRSHLYTEAMLRADFAVLQLRLLRDYEADLDEGERHRGRSALIGLVALKPAG